jgi:hypothetical protein
MSDEDRKYKSKANDDAEETTEDVEAHVRGGDRHASDESEDSGDDVEAHVKQT